MEISETFLFPKRFFQGFIESEMAYKILEEIKYNKQTIQNISEATEYQNVEEYNSNFHSPITLESVETFLDGVKQTFQKNGLTFDIASYWVAIYKSAGYHSLHTHKHDRFDRINYSGVLYLTTIGATTFYDNQMNETVASDFGKFILFPSDIPHTYEPTHVDSNNFRYVVPFNCFIYRN